MMVKRFSRYGQWSDLDEADEREELAEEQATRVVSLTSLLAPTESLGRARLSSPRIAANVQVTGLSETSEGVALVTPAGEIEIKYVSLSSCIRNRKQLVLGFGGGSVFIDIEEHK